MKAWFYSESAMKHLQLCNGDSAEYAIKYVIKLISISLIRNSIGNKLITHVSLKAGAGDAFVKVLKCFMQSDFLSSPKRIRREIERV